MFNPERQAYLNARIFRKQQVFHLLYSRYTGETMRNLCVRYVNDADAKFTLFHEWIEHQQLKGDDHEQR